MGRSTQVPNSPEHWEDYIVSAINSIGAWCPDLADDLWTMYYNDQITYGDTYTDCPNDIACALYGEIELNAAHYASDPGALEADLVHEAGHWIGGLSDDNTGCPNGQNHNAYDDGCPYGIGVGNPDPDGTCNGDTGDDGDGVARRKPGKTKSVGHPI